MTAATDERRSSILPLFIGVLLLPAVLGSSATIFNDGDVSWHIATGQWILDHRSIPHADPFSFTWAGKPWVPIEWLAELIYASAYRLASYGGVAAVVTAALMALHALGHLPGLWRQQPSTGRTLSPRPRVHALYAAARARQERLYQLLLPAAGEPEPETPSATSSSSPRRRLSVARGSGSRRRGLRSRVARR